MYTQVSCSEYKYNLGTTNGKRTDLAKKIRTRDGITLFIFLIVTS